jgi:hypothetical protein
MGDEVQKATRRPAPDPDFVAPTLAALAQALCLSDCARNGWHGCSFDGLVCMDRPGVEQQAKEALVNVR